MISAKVRALMGLLLGLAIAPQAAAGAEQFDAVSATSQSDTARIESGTVQVLITAVIRESMGVEYAAPLTMAKAAGTGRAANGTLVLAGVDRGRGSTGRDNELTTSIAIRGKPNQAFAVSLPDSALLNGARRSTGVAVISHDAGATPRVGPDGDTRFMIAARVDIARSLPAGGYAGTLDVIVSHN